jgi:hypothetical protein
MWRRPVLLKTVDEHMETLELSSATPSST